MAPELSPATEPSVRWILASKDFLRRHGRGLLLGLAALFVLVWLSQGLYTVGNGESAAVRRFGRLVDDAVGPGLHLSLPPGIDEVRRARTGDVFRLEVAEDFGTNLSLLTADENLIEARLVVQYRIARLGSYLFASEAPAVLVDQAVRSALVAAVAAEKVDEVLTTGKTEVQNRVRRVAQESLDAYGAGVALVSVSLQAIQPPREASGAFRGVSDARAEAAQRLSQASAESESALRLARGEAQQVLEQARAAADGRRQQARGAARRFEELLRRHRIAPQQTRRELYFAALGRTLPRTRLVLLAPGQTPRIDLNYLEAGAAPPPSFETP